jgi:hypothetical protein
MRSVVAVMAGLRGERASIAITTIWDRPIRHTGFAFFEVLVAGSPQAESPAEAGPLNMPIGAGLAAAEMPGEAAVNGVVQDTERIPEQSL